MREVDGHQVFAPDDEEVREARRALEAEGIQAGVDGYSTDQLVRLIELRGWRWELNTNDPAPNVPGNYARAVKRFGTLDQSVASRADTAADALTLVLALAIKHDRENKG